MKLLLTLFLCASFSAFSQINFQHGTLEEALKLAQKENKPVFVDVFAVWCGPCKAMANTVFSRADVGEYYNANFVNIKIDGEKNDGPGIMQKYGISAFPTLLYLNPDGTLIAKNVGGIDAQRFISKGREAIDPASSPLYQSAIQYHKSAKSRQDMKNYLQVLLTESSDSLDYYSGMYFTNYKDLNLQENVDFNVFYLQEGNMYSPLAEDFLKHPERTDNRAYIGKLSSFLQNSFASSVAIKQFDQLEKDVRYLYPYLSAASPQNGDVESYVNYVRSEFEKAVAN